MTISKKLIIGTAQFGQDYGITNTKGKVPKDEVNFIMNKARSLGITALDTASSYGSSEQTLGELGVGDIDIMTKLPSFNGISYDFRKFSEVSIKKSLSNLKVNSVDAVLLHRAEELLGFHGKDIYQSLLALKENGLTKKIGISIYSPEILSNIVPKYQFDIVQAPLNVFDRRIFSSGWAQKLSDSGVSIVARSIFLQGILLLKYDNLPKYFANWKKHFDIWYDFLEENNISALEASLNFVAQFPQVKKLIIGIESAEQFTEIITASENPIKAECDQLESDDLELISPLHWKT